MSDLHAMFINNITHSACYKVEMGVSAGDLTRNTLDNNHTAYKHICLQGIGCVCVKNYPPEIMQPSSSTRATIVSAENQNGATIVKATFFFCHYYIVWESNNAGEARGQSLNESLKSRWIPGGSCGYTSGTKRKHFAALSSPRPCWRWLQLQPSCGSPQWECARWMLLYLFQLLTQVLSWLLDTDVHRDSILHYHSLYRIFRNQTRRKNSIMHFIQQQQKFSVSTGVVILVIYVPKKDGVYCLIFRYYLCLLHSTW